MEEKKNNRKVILLILFVLLMAGVGSWYFYFRGKAPETEETKEETTVAVPLSDKQEQSEVKPDHASLLNGYWKSESTEDGRFLEFTVNYPEVENFNGISGKLEALDNYKFDYRLIFTDENGTSVFYINSLEGDSALVWYDDEGGQYDSSLKLIRDPESVPAVVTTEQPASTEQSSSTASTQDKPASNNTKPSGNTSASSGGSSSGSGNTSGKTGHYEERQVLVSEAYDEQVLVKKGECTSVCVQEAYDTEEMVYLDGAYYGSDMQEVLVCNQCGAVFYDDGIISHVANSDTCGSWHNDYVPINDPYWHNVEYKTVHHDAVYETKCEPDEYKTVHHDAVYKTEKVWVED